MKYYEIRTFAGQSIWQFLARNIFLRVPKNVCSTFSRHFIKKQFIIHVFHRFTAHMVPQCDIDGSKELDTSFSYVALNTQRKNLVESYSSRIKSTMSARSNAGILNLFFYQWVPLPARLRPMNVPKRRRN